MPVVWLVETDQKVVALTFDDGPLYPETERLLDVLGEWNAPATFFVRGGAIDPETKGSVVRAAEASHEVANHTHSHYGLGGVDRETIKEEILRTHHLLAELTGAEPDLIRPPYGDGLDVVDEVATPLGYRATVRWSITPVDWEAPPAAAIVQRVLDELKPGAIVLLHDGCAPEHAGHSRMETVNAVRALVPALRDSGFELSTVSRLLDYGAWQSF